MLGWQFHPEVTPQIVRRWGDGSRDQADRAGVSLEEVYAATDALAPAARLRTHALVDAFLDKVASSPLSASVNSHES